VTCPDPLERSGIGDAAAAARAEWRTEEDEWRRAAVEQWHHGRTLLDVVRDCMHRGDTVSVRIGTVTVTGTVCAVGDDVVSVAAPDGRADFLADARTPLLVRVVERAPRGGTRGEPCTTFRARLLELEASEEVVEIATASGDAARGRLVVGRDHLVADDDVVALTAVACVRVVAG
jgi:hypothetical protein